MAYGVATGAFIAAYTLWDKHAVDALMLPPVLYLWASTAGQALLLAPVAARRWEEVRAVWYAHRKEVVGVALLSPLAYLLVLAALVFTAVSYVAPVREVGILFGVLIGSQLLVEGHLLRRLTASGTMVLGIAALALGCSSGKYPKGNGMLQVVSIVEALDTLLMSQRPNLRSARETV